MSSLMRLRALKGFYRAGRMFQPGEVFRCEQAEALELCRWLRAEMVDEPTSWPLPPQLNGRKIAFK